MVPFAIAAAAIVSFRLRPLLNITAKQDIVEAIQDVSQLGDYTNFAFVFGSPSTRFTCQQPYFVQL